MASRILCHCWVRDLGGQSAWRCLPTQGIRATRALLAGRHVPCTTEESKKNTTCTCFFDGLCSWTKPVASSAHAHCSSFLARSGSDDTANQPARMQDSTPRPAAKDRKAQPGSQVNTETARHSSKRWAQAGTGRVVISRLKHTLAKHLQCTFKAAATTITSCGTLAALYSAGNT